MPVTFTTEILSWIVVIVAILAIVDAIFLILLAGKIKRLLGGSQAKDISEALVLIRKDLSELNKFRIELEKYLETVEQRLRRSVQSVETVRFNPFKGTGDGGNQSFATAFIDENGNGVVISSLYTRERVSVFSKPVANFKSSFELSEEEQVVIKNSEKNISKNSK